MVSYIPEGVRRFLGLPCIDKSRIGKDKKILRDMISENESILQRVRVLLYDNKVYKSNLDSVKGIKKTIRSVIFNSLCKEYYQDTIQYLSSTKSDLEALQRLVEKQKSVFVITTEDFIPKKIFELYQGYYTLTSEEKKVCLNNLRKWVNKEIKTNNKN